MNYMRCRTCGRFISSRKGLCKKHLRIFRRKMRRMITPQLVAEFQARQAVMSMSIQELEETISKLKEVIKRGKKDKEACR